MLYNLCLTLYRALFPPKAKPYRYKGVKGLDGEMC